MQKLPAFQISATRAIDRLSDAQVMAVQARILQGWTTPRIARELGVPVATVTRWFQEPMVMAAAAEMTRAVAALELLPLGLQRLRLEMSNPLAKTSELVRAVELFAKLAGLTDASSSNGAVPFEGHYGRQAMRAGDDALSRPLSELTANDLQALASRGQAALAELRRHTMAPADSAQSESGILE